MTRLGIMGPQGSGKTTQAKLVAESLGLCFISSGDLVREKSDQDDPEGREFNRLLSIGEMVPDQMVAKLVQDEISKLDCEKGFVMDGYPRRVTQVDVWDPEFDKVFYLCLQDDEVEKRLLLRGREDDTPDLIKERLHLYHERTEPVLSYYQEKGKLIKIDGHGSIEEVNQRVMENLK